jgi:microcystin-dependent protein
MSENFLGEIRVFSFNWPPMGWALCNGASIPVVQNQALYSLLGNQFGGDNTKFSLPDLCGRVPVQPGAGLANGLANGTETVSLLETNMPSHTHSVVALSTAGTSLKAGGKMLAKSMPDLVQHLPRLLYGGGAANKKVALDTRTVGIDGGGGAHANLQPYLAVNFCIATQGIYPMRP